MRRIVYAAIAASLLFCLPATAATDLVKLQDQVLGVTVQLNHNCSGTLFRSERDKKSGEVETLVLTAKHCVDDARKKDQIVDVPVYQKGRLVKRESYVATVKTTSYKRDLAILELKDKQTWFEKTATLAESGTVPIMGEDVWTAGYPGGNLLTITTGLFGSLETIDFPSDGVEYFRATPDVIGGNSGGAMYRLNGGNFELIGVTTAARRDHSFVAFYTPIDAIQDFVNPSWKKAAPHTP